MASLKRRLQSPLPYNLYWFCHSCANRPGSFKKPNVTDWECPDCRKPFDVERYATRMAPDVPLFVVPEEKPFVVMDENGYFQCPHCGKQFEDKSGKAKGKSSSLGKCKNKKVQLTLLMHPQWLEGCPSHDDEGHENGGCATDSVEATIRWNNARAGELWLLEVRGTLPEEVTCPESKIKFYTDRRGGTVPKQSTFVCAVDGSSNDVLGAIKSTGKTGPIAAYAVQGYSKNRDSMGKSYGGTATCSKGPGSYHLS